MAWDPTFLRWVGLPPGLEACLHSWLTPSGWKAGPPRIMTWASKSVWFAVSEYGDVQYRTGSGNTWPLLEETIDEWDAEAGFSWSQLAVSNRSRKWVMEYEH
jgi:hypothetical protein